MRQKHILAIGFKPGDIEISCGTVLAAHRAKNNLVTILHLSKNDNCYSKNKLVDQSYIEAEEAANIIKADVLFGHFTPDELKNSEESRLFVANLIRKIHPTSIITHSSITSDKNLKMVNELITSSILLGESSDVSVDFPPYNGVKGYYFTEHLANRDEFYPYIYINVSDYMNTWSKMIDCYEYYQINPSGYSYKKYYQALAKMRGNESYFNYACAFNISSHWKKQYNDIIL